MQCGVVPAVVVIVAIMCETVTNLYDSVSGFQSSVASCGAVFEDVLDEDASHHFPVAQATAHAPPTNNADTQRFSRLLVELHSLYTHTFSLYVLH